MFRSDASQVVTFAPDGSDPRWLGRSGHFTALTYSYALPGGADQLSGVLQIPPLAWRKALTPGRIVKVYRGASPVWDGKLDQCTAGDNGWQVTAHGAGTFGADFMAEYATWNGNSPVDRAITRGLRWVNPGFSEGICYLGQQTDSASVSVTDHLNNITSPAGAAWYVDTGPTGNVLSVFVPAWTTPTRILIASTPASPTLHGYPTVIWGRYQASADSPTSGAAATFATTSVTIAANAAKHGVMEFYTDLSTAGTKTSGQAQAILTTDLSKYIAASFADPFVVRPGQLRTTGGTAVDLGQEQAGSVCQLMLAAGGYGGEVAPSIPVTFLVGGYTYDDLTGTATVTPYQSARSDLASVLVAPPAIGTQPMIA